MDLFDPDADGSVRVRVPPQDLHAEQAILGSMLLEPEAAERVLAMLEDADFYREAHRVIYRAMQAVAARREPVDLITVSAELRREGLQDETGGPEYLTALIGEVPTTAHVVKYAGIVFDKSRLRQLVTLGMEAAAGAYEQPADVQAFAEEVEQRTLQIATHSTASGHAVRVGDLHAEDLLAEADEFVEEDAGEVIRRPKSGIPALDHETGGLRLPGLAVLPACTGFGKTTLAIQYAFDWAYMMHQPTVIFTTGEESRRDTVMRFAANVGKLDLSPRGIRDACRLPEKKAAFLGNLREYVELVRAQTAETLFIQPRLVSFDEFAAETRRLVRNHGVRFVVLDYLERCLHKEIGGGDKTRRLEALSGRCQGLQADLGIALLVVSQMTEDPATGESKTRYCAQLENDAHLTLRIDAAIKGTQEERRGQDKFVFIVRKQKKGASGKKFPVTRKPWGFVEETDERELQVRRDARDGLDGDG